MAIALRFTRSSASIAAVGAVAFMIGVLSDIQRLTADRLHTNSLLDFLVIAPNIVMLVLCYVAALTGNIYARCIFLVAALLHIPMLLDRSGDGALDVSEIAKIRFAEAIYSSSVLFDISALLFMLCAIWALFFTGVSLGRHK